MNRRPVSTKTAAFNIKAEQAQPIAQSPIRDEVCLRGQKIILPAKARIEVGTLLAQTPKAQGIEAANHHATIGYQYTLYLTQAAVRVATELQGVGHDNQIEALIGKRQSHIFAEQTGCSNRGGLVFTHPAMPYATALQSRNAGHSQL